MIIADYYELADVFYGDSFIDCASVFFKRLGLVESAEIKSYASEIKSWVVVSNALCKFFFTFLEEINHITISRSSGRMRSPN